MVEQAQAGEGNGGGMDRRVEERVEARLSVRFGELTDAARAFRAYSLNFSTGGLCLRTRRDYEVGARLSLQLSIGGEDFELQGSVAWVRRGFIGVRFENLSDQDRARLQAVIPSLRK